ncbi:NAD-dependent epimerase/dehydratase family protein [Actinotalea ferrariae]|uniref:NAD-dependent epimerase/dehydratase family protein n=1 Tax=Actinotalea ferrariae TaxID=1386098 RepID=UPI001C8BB181|nr:NAD-dependent epimerase/dehydratase family protein [Actinotalea ferrariae]MBX9243919.1 NAD-dependent epimerase/dehydratase family protein [Actinotalea ferrariae]
MKHVVLGKGPIGSHLAHQLADAGHDVVVLSRSGGPPAGPGAPSPLAAATAATPRGAITHAAVDAADADAVARAAAGAAALHNALNPAYHRWTTDWPPVAEALLTAAERTGAVYVMTGNLYGYGRGTRHMLEASPLATAEPKGRVRVAMWEEALRRHEDGRLRATEVRGSDYLGPLSLEHAHAGPRALRPLLAGKVVRPIGAADAPHTWTYLPDFARALVAAATTEAAWGRAWHVPSPEPLTFRELMARFATAAGAPEPRIRVVPLAMVRALGVAQPMMRELHAMGYQFVEPFVMDSAASQDVLGFGPTPWPTILDETLAWMRRQERVAA